MKKSLLFILCILSALNINAEIYEGSCGKNVSYTLDTETGLLSITGTGNMSWSMLPPWYNQRDYITSVKISDGVTFICSSAFVYHKKLTSVDIPNSVTIIGTNAFMYCTNLASITIPNSVTLIEPNAFANSGLTSITMGNNLTTIGDNAFGYCTSLTSIEIPNSVTKIDDNAFSYCSGLTSITIPNSVTSIGNAVLSGCTGLTSINVAADNKIYDSRNNCNAIIETSTNTLIFGNNNTIIPNSVTSIRRDAFSHCTDLTSIEIPNSVTSIGDNAFGYCTSLTSIDIPASVTSIGDGAFNNCSNLTSVTIPNSVTVTSIGKRTFEGCAKLTSIEIPNSVTEIGEWAFHNCSGLTAVTIPNSVTSIGNYAFDGCKFTSIEIPSSVTSIGNYAFSFCSGLTSITIPNSVTSIGDKAFSSCTGLTSIISEIEVPFAVNENVFQYYDNGYKPLTATLYVPEGTKSLYESTAGWSQFANIEEIIKETEATITISEAGEGTYCCNHDLDFTEVSGLKAYIASGFFQNSGAVLLTRVYDVPAYTGIMVKGEQGTYTVPFSTSYAYYSNMLKGNVAETTINPTDGDYTNYYLSDGENGLGFYKVTSAMTMSANHAYLQLPSSMVNQARSIRMVFTEDELTGISDVTGESGNGNTEDGTIYDMQGRKVTHPAKGMYIKNGKKIVIE